MKTSVFALIVAATGFVAADDLNLPDCAKGCLNDGLQKAGCTQDNIKDCYCPKANVNELVNCVTGACKNQNDLLQAAQAAQKACPNGTGNGNFNGIPGVPGTGTGTGNGGGNGGNNGGNGGRGN